MPTVQAAPTCPVQASARCVFSHSQGLVAAMQKLRRDLENCPSCPEYRTCPVLSDINIAVNNALREIVEEWKLG